MKMRILSLVLLTPLVNGCAGVALGPVGPPDEFGTTLVEYIDAGAVDEAEDLFDRIADDEEYRQQLYPILFNAGRDRYSAGDTSDSSAILRFMADSYPEAVAVREALVYSLFLERAEAGQPTPELSKEIDATIADLRGRTAVQPGWVDLVAAQQAIDKGDLGAAREAMINFLDVWKGEPQFVLPYVEDIERYLRSH